MANALKQASSPISASDQAAALKLTPVSRETEGRLQRYVDLLLEWQAKTNLIAPSTLPNLWTRHISDSLQLLSLAPSAVLWADLGSGGGFPGIVLACGLAETPGAMIHLVERNAKKAAFLREALRVTGSPGTVHLADIGDSVDRITGKVDCVTARALAPGMGRAQAMPPAATSASRSTSARRHGAHSGRSFITMTPSGGGYAPTLVTRVRRGTCGNHTQDCYRRLEPAGASARHDQIGHVHRRCPLAGVQPQVLS